VKISRVEAPRCQVGEGALWDADAQALYFLDIVGRQVHRLDPAKGQTRSWATPAPVGAMALRSSGGVVLGLQRAVGVLDVATGAVDRIAALDTAPDRTTINDGKADRRGRFVFGLCDTNMQDPQPVGGLYGLDRDHRLTMLDGGVCFSNSPCFSPDGQTLYFADSFTKTVYAYDYELETGQVSGRRLFADTTDLGGLPDGSTVDRDGLIWMAIFQAGRVAAFRPDGKVERVVDLPVRLISSVAFGGPDLDQLYATTIDPGFFGEPAEPGAGDLYVIEGLGTRGLPEPRFAG
jgi:L-arabinonolactonase